MPAKSGDAADVCQPSLDDRDYPISLSVKRSGAVFGYFGVIGYGRDFTPSAPPSGQGYSFIRPGEASPTDPREFGRCANFRSSSLEFPPRTGRPFSQHQRVAGHLRPRAPHKEVPFYPHSLCLHWLSYYSQILVRQRLVVTAFSARSPSASECFLSQAAKSALEKNVRAF